ncbi:MAG: mucoidy inhibitor MuiA family protein [Opitutae bacterium]|nr:mucoidy inhibitor MuiA family protein [Opitutae bacterium]
MKKFIHAAVVAIALSPLLAAGEEISHSVAKAEIFTDRAVLTRTGTANLKEGRNEIVFAGIRDNVDLRSIRVGDIMPADVEVLGVSWERHVSTTVDNAKIAELESKLSELGKQLFVAENELAATEKLLSRAGDFSKLFSESVNAKAFENSGDKPAPDWATNSEQLRAELQKLATTKAELDSRVKKIKREIEPVATELNKIYGGGNARRSLSLVLAINAKQSESAPVSVAYTTRTVSWEPSYDLSLGNGGDSDAEFAYRGTIRQNTGEDWKGVAITLSTAQPQISARPPRATTISLSGRKLDNPDEREIVEVAADKPVPATLSLARADAGDNDAETAARDNADFSDVRGRGATVTFVVAGTHDVPTGSREHQVEIAQEKLAVQETRLEAAPRLRGDVYWRAELKNDDARPIVAGKLRVCRDAGFIGIAQREYVPAGATFAIFAGAESGLSASCETLAPLKESGSGKFFSASETTVEGDIYKIANLTTNPRKVRVRSQIKVSEIDDVKISILDKQEKHIPATTPGYVLEKETGMVYWDVEVPANSEKTLILTTKTERK